MNRDFLLKNKFVIIALTAVLCSVVVFFAFRYLTPFGAVVSYQFNSVLNGDKISKINGAEETSSFNPTKTGVLQIPQQTIRQNVVTFNLKLITKPIEGVWVNLRFKGNPKEIKIGVRGSEKENYQYKPLYNQILDSLSWNKTVNDGVTFWQREKKYKDISDLASKPPISNQPKIASYFYNLSDIVMKENSSSSQSSLKIEKTLRGSHTLLIKVDKKPFLLTVVKQDINAYKGEDVLSVQIYNGQNKIAEQIIPDDGVTDVSKLMMAPQKSEIKINDIKPGVYTIVLKDMTKNADILIKSIETNQSSLVSNRVFIDDGKPTTLWTNSKEITMITSHATSVQTVKLDNNYNLKVEKEGKTFAFDLTNPESKTATSSAAPVLHKLEIPKNDLNISGDGYFSFSKESFFNPEPIKTVDLSTVSDISTVDYIIANYQKAKKDSEWYTAQAYFDPKDIKVDGDKLYFSLESPDLSSYGGEIVIDNLEVTVKKPGWIKAVSPTPKITEEKQAPNFFQKIINFFKNIFSKKENVSKPLSGSPTPTTKLSPTSVPTATPTPRFQDLIKITVLNGGAGKGSAGTFASVLKNNGFANPVASNAAVFDYKNVTIKYQETNSQPFKEVVAKIKKLLMQDYNFVTEERTGTEPMNITIILGENPKDVTPTPVKSLTPTATPTTTLTPTIKP